MPRISNRPGGVAQNVNPAGPPNGDGGSGAITLRSMGTVLSIRFGGPVAPELGAQAREAVGSVFAAWDTRFSLYRDDSELSRINRGELRLTQASPVLRDCYAAALDWRDRTDGVFTPHRADGVLDLSGVVKALAIEEGGGALRGLGLVDWSLNAGGDVLGAGDQTPGLDWVAGLVDPDDRGLTLAAVPLALPLRAVATSGSAERGDHIWTAVGEGASSGAPRPGRSRCSRGQLVPCRRRAAGRPGLTSVRGRPEWRGPGPAGVGGPLSRVGEGRTVAGAGASCPCLAGRNDHDDGPGWALAASRGRGKRRPR